MHVGDPVEAGEALRFGTAVASGDDQHGLVVQLLGEVVQRQQRRVVRQVQVVEDDDPVFRPFRGNAVGERGAAARGQHREPSRRHPCGAHRRQVGVEQGGQAETGIGAHHEQAAAPVQGGGGRVGEQPERLVPADNTHRYSHLEPRGA